MTPKQRVWIIVGVSVAVTAIVGLVSVRWAQRAFRSVLAESQVVYAEGRALGRTLTANACVDTAMARHARAGGSSFGKQIHEGVFLEACLGASAPTDMCDNVPSAEGLRGMVRFTQWSQEQCTQRGLRDRGCPPLYQAVMHYCGRRAKTPGGTPL
jgi:hypothetical protein